MVTAALINDTLSAVGAVGGLLSIVGVGLLILLVASQSRQIRAMREWIEQEPQRQQETAQRVIAEVQRRIAAARERRTGVPVPPESTLPGAAAGVKPAPGTLGATPEAQAIAARQTAGNPPTEIQTPGFAPLTPAGGGEGASIPPPTLPGDDDPAIVKDILNQETQVSDTLPDEEYDAVAAAAVPSARSRDQRFGEDQFELDEDEPRSNRLLFGVGAAALLAGIIFGATLLFGGDDPAEAPRSKAGGDTPRATTPRRTPAASTVEPSTIVVRVFNGTQINGLARKATDELKAADYSVGEPQTRSSSVVQSTTQVMYRSNFKSAATQIAKELGVPSSAVQPIDTDTSVDAGETAEVVVITGADLDDGSASGTTTTG